MTELPPAGRVEFLDLSRDERRELLELLSELKPAEWEAPTECPAWSVKGIALHLLGDDLSILSRQRDGVPSRVALEAGARGWDQLFAILDRFNEQLVDALADLSPPLLLELLRLTGEWTHQWYATVDPERQGEPVAWAGPEPAPYWFLGAREYLERWVHHLQILRALGRPGLHDARHVVPAVAVAARGFPAGFALVPAEPGTTVTLSLAGGPAWTVAREAESWELYDGAPAEPTVRLPLDLDTAALLFSRGLTVAELQERLRCEGDDGLASVVVAGLAAFFGRA